MKNIKVVFMGTPSFAVPTLKSLIKNLTVVMVVCQPDREKDRKGNILFPPCKNVAIENNIEVFQPQKIKSDYQPILDKNPDIIVTCAYGQIIPEEVLNYPKFGCINVHGSLLPKLRGGAPIHHAIINGDKKTGITIMYMDKKMDAGDIISQRDIEIGPNEKLDDLYEKMSYLGSELLEDTLFSIIEGTNSRTKQKEEDVTFGLNITKEEEYINFNNLSYNVHNKVRGLSSTPGAYAILNGKRVKIYETVLTTEKSKKEPGTIEKVTNEAIYVSTKDFLIGIIDLKIEGKKRYRVKDFVNGIKKEEYIGSRFE